MRSDGDKCVISGHNETDDFLDAAHIVPFPLAKWESDDEKRQKIAAWENILRYFPSVSTRLNFYYQQINDLKNVSSPEPSGYPSKGHFHMGRMVLTIPDTDDEDGCDPENDDGFDPDDDEGWEADDEDDNLPLAEPYPSDSNHARDQRPNQTQTTLCPLQNQRPILTHPI
ncbi:hypothetical protein CNMCM5793_000034 [Aspergillus hiratsukae]|uniref:HNH nuclease domain-containing protein n=1 Tax=Aspergillus hiratsukae TaxID=1194566 RepID=A0A8H6PTM5_9EURO|nr:hypothetical protein CNMCM5793_000034 [Aspergillus hiratsukae]KAF7160876.1 hypothetical protein CNMCM6106_008237 [Aspergillus hiratsukae]